MADIPAASASYADVNTAVSAAANGDRVLVPAGSATWTTEVRLDNKYITLKGAGIGQTIITDNASDSNHGALEITAKAGGLTRITGFTWQGGTHADTEVGIIHTIGESTQFRIDHNKFITTHNAAVRINGDIVGVIDHNDFSLAANFYAIYVVNGNTVATSWGDPSWHRASPFGTSDNVFIEDNTFSSAPDTFTLCVDGFAGGRYVFRHNVVTETNGATSHGVQSQLRYRAFRHTEVYENTFSRSGSVNQSEAFGANSGTGVFYNNIVTGASYTGIANFGYARDTSSQVMWGQAGKLSVDSITRSGSTATLTIAAGHHINSPNGFTPRVLISGANQSEYNGTFDVTYISATQVSFTVSGTPATPATGTILAMSPWDGNTDVHGYPAIDQVGYGVGDLLTDVLDVGPAQWPNQASEPFYVWNNKLNGVVTAAVTDASQIVENRDFFNGTVKPGYVAFQYPHPLNIDDAAPIPEHPGKGRHVKHFA